MSKKIIKPLVRYRFFIRGDIDRVLERCVACCSNIFDDYEYAFIPHYDTNVDVYGLTIKECSTDWPEDEMDRLCGNVNRWLSLTVDDHWTCIMSYKKID